MAGYMAMGRVRGGGVRAITRGVDTERHADVVVRRPVRDDGRAPAGAVTPPPTLRERWDSLREELGIMTFFLLDPESWR
jgi:hypothetical protein